MSSKNTQGPTIAEWLGEAYYDWMDGVIRTPGSEETGPLLVADIRGWSWAGRLFDDETKAEVFLNNVGIFVAAAIREKLEREKALNIPSADVGDVPRVDVIETDDIR